MRMEGNTVTGSSMEQTRFACNKIMDSSIRSLYQIWERMGIDESQKKARGDTAVMHLKNLMQHIISDEEALMNQVAKTIEDFTEKLDQLCTELSLPHIKLSGGLTMVQKEKILRNKVETMAKEKKDRMTKYETLHTRDLQLSKILSTTPFYVSSDKVPSLEQLRDLEKHVKTLQEEKEKRLSELTTIKSQIIELYSSLDTEPDSSFSCELICEDDDSLGLSMQVLDKVRKLREDLVRKNESMQAEANQLWERLGGLWNRLDTSASDRELFKNKVKGHGAKVIQVLKAEVEACELLKFQNLRKFVDGLRKELSAFWDKCFFSKDQRELFKGFCEAEYTEELLKVHEQELERVRHYYNTHKLLLEKIAHRNELFRNMIDFEEKASDPNRFFCDRGGRLLQEEKARKKLTKELPKVEDDVTEAVQKWEQENQKDFLVNGVKFSDYLKQSWDNFQTQKERQKQSRLKARAKQTQEEMMYGSNKAINLTPGKRRIPPSTTPVKTPLKTRKVGKSSSIEITVKIEYDWLNDMTRTPTNKGLYNVPQPSIVLHSPAVKQEPLNLQASPMRPKKKSSLHFKKVTGSRAAVGSLQHLMPSDVISNLGLDKENHSCSVSLASHGSYSDFANLSPSKTSSPDTQHS